MNDDHDELLDRIGLGCPERHHPPRNRAERRRQRHHPNAKTPPPWTTADWNAANSTSSKSALRWDAL